MYNNLGRLIYLLCGIVLLVFAATSLVITDYAGTVADDIHSEAQRELVGNEIKHQIETVARDQSQVSNWNATIEALGEPIDRRFIRAEIVEWLWSDFDIISTIIVGPNGEPRVTVYKSALLSPQSGTPMVVQNADLIQDAQTLYMERRMPHGDGFTFSEDPVWSENPIYASDIRELDGQISIVIAQAIVPHGNYVVPDGLPHIMLTYKAMTDLDLAIIQEKLGFSGFDILKSGVQINGSQAKIDIGKRGLQAVWNSDKPSSAIWSQLIWPLVLLIALVGLSLYFVSRRYDSMVTALQNSEARNKFLAMHDALTGLPNRFHFDQALEKIISDGEQDRCAILCLDLDRFKVVNDVWGHQAGDEVIRAVAQRMSKIVGDNGIAARIGGDEFIVLLRNQLEQKNVTELCDKLIAEVCKKVKFDGGSANVGVSIGVAWWPDHAKTAKMIIRSADEALYRAKEAGRGRVYLAQDIVSNDNASSQATGNRAAA
ncbi:MAG: diguanylate cyclase [Pseudomonadota bacterium]